MYKCKRGPWISLSVKKRTGVTAVLHWAIYISALQVGYLASNLRPNAVHFHTWSSTSAAKFFRRYFPL